MEEVTQHSTYVEDKDENEDLTGCYVREVVLTGNEFCPVCGQKLGTFGRRIEFGTLSIHVTKFCQNENCKSEIEHVYWLEEIEVKQDGRFRKE